LNISPKLLESLWICLIVKRLPVLLLICSVLTTVLLPLNLHAEPEPFRLTLFADPSSLDPQMQSSAGGNYLTTLISRGLYRWNKDDQLEPDEGQCKWIHHLSLQCELSVEAHWSDGKEVTAEDYLRSFLFLLNPSNGAPQAHLLFDLKNAREIYQGKKENSALGFKILSPKKFQLTFSKDDQEFMYKWVHPALFPRHKSWKRRFRGTDTPTTNGAFFVKSVLKSGGYGLSRNLYIFKSKDYVSKLEVLVVESDTTTVQLYESGKIQFARRVPAELFPRFKNTPDFYAFPVLRFDYIGFGPALKDHPKLRKGLMLGFDQKGFQKIFDSEGKPGCPPIPSSFFSGFDCYPRKPKPTSQKLSWPKNFEPTFAYSQMGGEDIKRAVEWFQGQWKNHLSLPTEIEGREQKVYLQWLRTSPPALFRKGMSLDRPTCLAALENFQSEHPENYIRFKDKEFDKLLLKMKRESDPKKLKKLCSKGLKKLIGDAHMIPLGQMHFSILVHPSYTGWELNSLNQLFLNHLQKKSVSK